MSAQRVQPLRIYVDFEEFVAWGCRPEVVREGRTRSGQLFVGLGLALPSGRASLEVVMEADPWQRARLNWRQYPGRRRWQTAKTHTGRAA